MRVFLVSLALVCSLALTGCGSSSSTNSLSGTLSPDEAARTKYPYGFSGQVKSAVNGQVITNFAVTLLGNSPSSGAVLNGLGSRDGVFHVSREASSSAPASVSVPAIVSAPGFAPLLQMLTVGTNCQSAGCTGSVPASVVLQPLAEIATTLLTDATSATALSPATVVQQLLQEGTASLISGLVQSGKLDPNLASQLANSNVNAPVSNLLVLLNGSGTAPQPQQIASIVTTLLSAITSGQLNPSSNDPGAAIASIISTFLPLAVSANPQVAAALAAMKVLLPYLAPITSQLGAQGGPLGQLIAALLNTPTPNAPALPGNAQQTLASIGAIVGSIITAAATPGSNPLQGILVGVLGNGGLLQQILQNSGNPNDAAANALLSFLNPFIQALGTQNGAQLATLFNQLVQQGGVAAIQALSASNAGEFAALLPFLQPLIQGLNGANGAQIASLLAPVLAQTNPAQSLASLLNAPSGQTGLQAIESLVPGLASLLQQAVPAKQVLSAQLLQGRVNHQFSSLQVVRDVPGAAGVIVSGSAQDIIKLAQLPNVARVVSVANAQ